MPEWMQFTAWCPDCKECHTGITAMEVIAFSSTHMHPHVQCSEDNVLLDRMHDEIQRVLQGEIAP